MQSHLDGWTVDDLADLTALAVYNLVPDEAFLTRLKRVTGLLPPQAITPLGRDELKSRVPAPKEVASWDDKRIAALALLRSTKVGRMSDELVLAVWPARAKTDLSIRRTRFRDCAACYVAVGEEEAFWRRCEALPGFDVISVCNILNASFIFESDAWFETMQSWGAFRGDVSHYTAVAKVVSDCVKKFPIRADLSRWRFAECGVMTGYRNPPFPGFDVVDETKSLAEGGGRHGLCEADSLKVFSELVDSSLRTEGEWVEWVGFTEWVVAGDWETGGSSSVGVVEWVYDGADGEEKGHFKARKNLVPDVYDMAQLAAEALASKDQVNKAIIKSELGKLRMAVASDIYTYLKMAWITRLMGGSYLKWEGSTIEEDVYQQTDRMLDMLAAITRAWNLPFDYASFDHQPTTAELKLICAAMIDSARANVAADHRAEFDAIAHDVLDSFDRSTISVVDAKGGRHTFGVTGGVMSGLRWTTVLGNGWNTVMTKWVMRVLASLGVSTDEVRRWIRGDDSAIVTESYAKTLLFRQGYAAVGAVGGDGKFGIHYGQSEFLRVWYDAVGCHGYASRAIPGLLQRKPWSSAPWEEESTMAHIYDNVRTLRRRGADGARLDVWWRVVAHGWSVRKKRSVNYLQVPKKLGGLGVVPWDGKTFAREPWPKTDVLRLRVTNQTPWRAQQLFDRYSKVIPITVEESAVLAADALAKKVASDDVPSLNSVFRKEARLPAWAPFDKVEPFVAPKVAAVLQDEVRVLASLRATKGAFRSRFDSYNDDTYGKNKHLAQQWADVSDVFRVRRQTGLLRWFADRQPEFVSDVRSLERRGLSRSEALDWTFGSMPINVVRQIHPALTGLVGRAVVAVAKAAITSVKLRARQLTQIVALATGALEQALCSSKMSQVVYSW